MAHTCGYGLVALFGEGLINHGNPEYLAREVFKYAFGTAHGLLNVYHPIFLVERGKVTFKLHRAFYTGKFAVKIKLPIFFRLLQHVQELSPELFGQYFTGNKELIFIRYIYPMPTVVALKPPAGMMQCK